MTSLENIKRLYRPLETMPEDILASQTADSSIPILIEAVPPLFSTFDKIFDPSEWVAVIPPKSDKRKPGPKYPSKNFRQTSEYPKKGQYAQHRPTGSPYGDQKNPGQYHVSEIPWDIPTENDRLEDILVSPTAPKRTKVTAPKNAKHNTINVENITASLHQREHHPTTQKPASLTSATVLPVKTAGEVVDVLDLLNSSSSQPPQPALTDLPITHHRPVFDNTAPPIASANQPAQPLPTAGPVIQQAFQAYPAMYNPMMQGAVYSMPANGMYPGQIPFMAPQMLPPGTANPFVVQPGPQPFKQAEPQWQYIDIQGTVQGPFPQSSMRAWYMNKQLPPDLKIRVYEQETEFLPLELRWAPVIKQGQAPFSCQPPRINFQ